MTTRAFPASLGGPALLRDADVEQYMASTLEVDIPAFWLPLRDGGRAAAGLYEPRLERAIGVIHRPDSELASHCSEARLPEQFDAVIHVDRTRALEPLERTAEWQHDEPPETYPTAL